MIGGLSPSKSNESDEVQRHSFASFLNVDTAVGVVGSLGMRPRAISTQWLAWLCVPYTARNPESEIQTPT